MSRRNRFHVARLAVVAALLVASLLAIVGPTNVAAAAATDAQRIDVRSGEPAATTPNVTQHENPEDVPAVEDRSEALAWLSGTLDSRLSDAAIAISEERYDAVDEHLGDRYEDRLSQYVDVAGDTDDDGDDEAADVYDRTATTEREFGNQTREYDRAYRAYEAATDRGDEATARRQARRLERIAERVARQNRTLQGQFDALANRTGGTYAEPATAIARTASGIQRRQAEVRTATFTAVDLTARATNATASYTAPATVEGRLRTDSGPLTERSVRLRVANRTRTVRTDGDGRFRTTFRPRTQTVGTNTIPVEYRPAPTSVYLRATDAASVNVTQVTPTLSAVRTPSTAGFGDSITVEATLQAGSVAVSDVPLVVRVGGQTLTRLRTNASGRAAGSVRIPASVPDGTRRIEVGVPYRDRAIAGVTRNLSLAVPETRTRISLDGAVQAGTVVVEGRLATAGGAGVGDEPVTVRVGEASGRTVRTAADGTITARVETATLPANETVTVVARYDEPGSNLAPATARASVRLPSAPASGDSAGSGGGDGSQNQAGVTSDLPVALVSGLVALAGIAGIGALVYVRRGTSTEDGDTDAAVGDTDAADGQAATPADDATEPDDAPRPDQTADTSTAPRIEASLDRGDTESAIVLAYEAVRTDLVATYELSDALTPSELVVACTQRGLEDAIVDDLVTLTALYELAAFAPTEPDVDAGERALDILESIRDASDD